jgi:DDE superfamily endonuclease
VGPEPQLAWTGLRFWQFQHALERVVERGLPHLILDGTVITADRLTETRISKKGKEIDYWYGGKKRHFGGVVQALTAPNGIPLWVSDVLPGSTHDLTAAREQVLATLWLYTKTMPVPADGGYDGAGCGVLTPPFRSAPTESLCISTSVPTTSCCAAHAAWASAVSHCCSNAGRRFGTSP